MNTRVSQYFGVGTNVEVQRINMQLCMKMQKKNDTLGVRNLAKTLAECDVDNKGVMDFEEFEEGLKKYK
jgi:Ca2+-binding EF-hand superfamily protein